MANNNINKNQYHRPLRSKYSNTLNEGIGVHDVLRSRPLRSKYSNILNESKESKAQSKTRDVIRQIFENRFNLDDYAKDGEGNMIKDGNGNPITILNYLEHQIRNEFYHDTNIDWKFESGIARIAYGELGLQANEDTRKISSFKKIMEMITSAHANEYDSNLNGLSYEELNERFGGNVKQISNDEYNRINSLEYTSSNYIIKKINSFEDAEEFYDYTNPESRWCITYRKDMWDRYTSNGVNNVYFAYVPNFKQIKCVAGKNAPLDEYGLSLISIIIDSFSDNGDMRACTTRWNHKNGGSDNAMNEEQVSKLLGGSIYKLCPKKSREELHEIGVVLWDEVQQMLDDGVNPKDIFDNIDNFGDGFSVVHLNGKVNIINSKGKILSNQWFDYCNKFHEGFAVVQLNHKSNFINQEGKIISNQWFDTIFEFNEGFAKVELNDKYNFIDTKGKIISNQWFDIFWNFNEGFAKVELNGKFNFINTKGKILSNQWFDNCGRFHKGFATVKLNGRWTQIDTEGKLYGI